MPLILVTAPTTEPVSLDEAKAWLKVDGDDDNDTIAAMIAAARRQVEALTGRALIRQVWRLELDEVPDDDELMLPRPPLVSVDSVQYVDSAGATQTWSSTLYQVQSDDAGRAMLAPAYGEAWPTVRCQFGAFKVQYTAGYGDTADYVPEQARVAIKMMAAFLYQHRGDDDAKVPDYIRHVVGDLIVYG